MKTLTAEQYSNIKSRIRKARIIHPIFNNIILLNNLLYEINQEVVDEKYKPQLKEVQQQLKEIKMQTLRIKNAIFDASVTREDLTDICAGGLRDVRNQLFDINVTLKYMPLPNIEKVNDLLYEVFNELEALLIIYPSSLISRLQEFNTDLPVVIASNKKYFYIKNVRLGKIKPAYIPKNLSSTFEPQSAIVIETHFDNDRHTQEYSTKSHPIRRRGFKKRTK